MPVFQAEDGPKDVYAKIKQYGADGQSSLILKDGEPAIGKLRLVGVYDDNQRGYFMLRIRVPGGRLDGRQAETVGRIADLYALRPESELSAPERFLEITTRQDIQLHWMHLDDLPNIWEQFEQVGLTTLQACGDTARNITGCPVAGIDRSEVMDVYPLVQEITSYALEHPEIGAFLPRKFKIAASGCLEDCILARINDLALVPARRDGEIGFNVWAGGGLSDYPRLASDMDIFVSPNQAIPLVKATIGVFKDFGDYHNKAVNRFRRVVEELGPDKVRQEMLDRLPFAPRSAGEDLTQAPRHDHVGIHPQRQDGLHYVGLAVPVGRMTGRELIEASRLARVYGDGGVRLTVRQNLIVTGVPEAGLDSLLKEPLLQRLSPEPRQFERSLVACTSAPFCKFGILNVKERGGEIAAALDQAFPDGDLGPMKIHVSGCKASCAQVQIADIGLRASMAKDENGFYEAFDIAAGGNIADGLLAKWIQLEVPVPKVRQGLARMFGAYQSQRSKDEKFGQFVRRLDSVTLSSFFQEERT
ncbi:MAG: ferredoxin--nitrite reductase [Dehalococcoidia bacterium]